MESQQTILLFEIEEKKDQAICKVCEKLRIGVLHVDKESYGQQFGYLAGIKGFTRSSAEYHGKGIPAEMMVFCGMDSDCVDEFLKVYREAMIAPIGCKAILTPNNIFWTPEELFKELLQEHMFFLNNKK